MSTNVVVILRAGTTWTVPFNWNKDSSVVICIGAGAGGGNNNSGPVGGGGGGARAITYNLDLTPGSTVPIGIGAGGSAGSSGGATSFNNGLVFAQGGSTATTATGGLGGQASASIGGITYSGGNGGNGGISCGGGGGAAGDAGNGFNGSDGFAGAGGANDGGDANWPGFDLGSLDSRYGSNWAGGGGNGGAVSYDKNGFATVNPGAIGQPFGGGGGGGNNGGAGGNGAIIISWNWDPTIKSSGPLSIFELKRSLIASPVNASMNDADTRALAARPSGAIAISDFYNKSTDHPTYIGFASSGTASSATASTLPTGWQVGDMCILITASWNQEMVLGQTGWTYAGKALGAANVMRLNVFYRILQSGDTAPTFNNVESWQTLLFRNAGRLINRWVTNNTASGTVTLGGFTKTLDSRKIFTVAGDAPYYGTSNPTPTPPAGWTTHAKSGALLRSYSQISTASIASGSYTNGSSVSWTNMDFGFTGASYAKCAILFEME